MAPREEEYEVERMKRLLRSRVLVVAAVAVSVGIAWQICKEPFACRAVDDGFFDTAPHRFEAEAELPVSAAVAFRAFDDAAAWPRWFAGIHNVEWTTPRPFGVGTTRDVTLDRATVHERFFRWEEGRRITFYVAAHDAAIPLFRALAEDYRLDDLPDGRSRFTYRVALEPSMGLGLAWPFVGPGIEAMFKNAPSGLARYLARPLLYESGPHGQR